MASQNHLKVIWELETPRIYTIIGYGYLPYITQDSNNRLRLPKYITYITQDSNNRLRLPKYITYITQDSNNRLRLPKYIPYINRRIYIG